MLGRLVCVMCFFCRCSMIIVLMFLMVWLKFLMNWYCGNFVVFGISEVGLYRWMLCMFSVFSVCMFEWVMCECFMLL